MIPISSKTLKTSQGGILTSESTVGTRVKLQHEDENAIDLAFSRLVRFANVDIHLGRN